MGVKINCVAAPSLLIIYLTIFPNVVEGKGILFPQESRTRERKSLDGIWNFRIAPRDDPDQGFRDNWSNQWLSETGDVILMPVPSSYNDVTQNKTIRDHVGWAWYDRPFWVPASWLSSNLIINLRFGAVNYHATVWVNGQKVGEHAGGHLPFVFQLDKQYLSTVDKPNRLTVAINNTLSEDTVPQGSIVRPTAKTYPPGYFTNDYDFDFFNYAGIHRPVYLFTTPTNFIDDITVWSSIDRDGSTGFVDYDIEVVSQPLRRDLFSYENDVNYPGNDISQDDLTVSVELHDKLDRIVASGVGNTGVLYVANATLWWPFTMVTRDEDAGYLYTFVAYIKNSENVTIDQYSLKVGIRTVFWNSTAFTINGKPFYFRGFGRHEDFDVRGRAIDPVMIVKDHNLVRWTGANSYRTSHYPYSEEIMDLCDSLGIVIIDEISAVGLKNFGDGLRENHKQQLGEMMRRDKNRASVVMWSVANEPDSHAAAAGPYFRAIFETAKVFDSTRPVTVVLNAGYENDQAAQYADVICINRYFGWYSDTGHTEVITRLMLPDVHNWISTYQRPVMVTEYGADTVPGLHMNPEYVFTEDYQLTYLREHFKAFDQLRNETGGQFIGEMIWNFADFMTSQKIIRVLGNKKGLFTRERQPKAAAHLVRMRYHYLAELHDGYPIPEDLPKGVPVYSGGKTGGILRHDEV